jgi:hypothetical protein
MATYKVLGQVNPSAATLTTLYTVPAATQTVISTISVCNQASAAATYRIAVRVAGSAISAEEYIVYGATVPASDSIFITAGITLGATDVLTVYSSSATVSFNAYGSEIA